MHANTSHLIVMILMFVATGWSVLQNSIFGSHEILQTSAKLSNSLLGDACGFAKLHQRASNCTLSTNVHTSGHQCQPLSARGQDVCYGCELPLTLNYERLFDRSLGENAKRMNSNCARHFLSSTDAYVSTVEATDCLDNTDNHFVCRSWQHRLPRILMFLIRNIVMILLFTTARSQTIGQHTLKLTINVGSHTYILYNCLSVRRSINCLLDIITNICCFFNSLKNNAELLPKNNAAISCEHKITSKIETYGCNIYKQLYEHDSDCSMIDDIYTQLRKRVWLRLDAFAEFDHHLQPTAWVAPVLSPVNRIIDRLANHERVNPRESMRHESLRLCTFRTYPTSEKPSCVKLAKAGFYYASQGDEVICYCCAKRISNWNERDDPMRAHRLVSPSCPFLIRNSEVNEPVTDDGNESTNSALTRLLNSLDNIEEDTASNTADRTHTNEPIERQISLSSDSSDAENIEPRRRASQSGACGMSTDIISFNNTAKVSSNNIDKSTDACYMSLPAQPCKRSIPAGNCVLDHEPATSVLVAACASNGSTTNAHHTHRQFDADRKYQSPETDLRAELLRENRALKAQSLCMKCHRNEVCIAFLPCGHLVSCEACSTDPSARKCFSCDAAVKARIKAFIV